MVGEVEAAPSMAEDEGGVMTAAVLMLATSLTGIGVSGVSVLLTPEGGGATKHSKLGSATCR